MNFSMVTGLVVGSISALVAVQPAGAAQSHLMQQPERHVVLRSVNVDQRDPAPPCSYWDKEFAEVTPTGVLSEAPFNIPDGHVLVVTDLDWRIDEGESTKFDPTHVLEFAIYLGDPLARVFSSGRRIGDHVDIGMMLGNASLTTGFRVAPGTPICASGTAVDEFGGVNHEVTDVTLRGYLIQDSARKVAR